MSSKAKLIVHAGKQVKPILSLDRDEARRRVFNLYRAWYRQVPYICHDFNLEVTERQMRDKVREKFLENRHVSDIRVIDLLVIKGQMELTEIVKMWKQPCHIMTYFKPSINPKPKDFISKFLAGKDSE